MTGSMRASFCLTISFLVITTSAGVIQVATEALKGDDLRIFSLLSGGPTAGALRSFEAELENSSLVVRLLRPWVQYVRFVALRDAGEKVVRGRGGWFFYKPTLSYFSEPDRAGSAETALGAIVGFRDQLAVRGIHLLVLPGPNKASIYPEMLTRRGESLPIAVSQTTERLLAGLAESNVEVVDLFGIFQRGKYSSGPPLYLSQDTHWSPDGVALAARAVAERLLGNGWVTAGNLAYRGRPSSFERVGDLIRMQQARPLERLIGPERVNCVRIAREADGTPYRDDPEAEVLVMGDSFLRIYQSDGPGSAGFVAQLAKELRQPLASIVSDGGASTLVRQELYRRPALLTSKKVVIWQFVERDIRFGLEGWQDVPLPPDQREGNDH